MNQEQKNPAEVAALGTTGLPKLPRGVQPLPRLAETWLDDDWHFKTR